MKYPGIRFTIIFYFRSPESITSTPSPRILNTHFAASCLPEQIVSKNTRIINVVRNPKDIVTSYYHHLKQLNAQYSDDHKPFETFSDFIPYVTGEYGVCECFLKFEIRRENTWPRGYKTFFPKIQKIQNLICI